MVSLIHEQYICLRIQVHQLQVSFQQQGNDGNTAKKCNWIWFARWRKFSRHENPDELAVPAAVGEQFCPTAPEQARLRGSSRPTRDHDLPPSGCWDQLPYWIQPEVWSLNWKDIRQCGVRITAQMAENQVVHRWAAGMKVHERMEKDHWRWSKSQIEVRMLSGAILHHIKLICKKYKDH